MAFYRVFSAFIYLAFAAAPLSASLIIPVHTFPVEINSEVSAKSVAKAESTPAPAPKHFRFRSKNSFESPYVTPVIDGLSSIAAGDDFRLPEPSPELVSKLEILYGFFVPEPPPDEFSKVPIAG